MQTEYINKAKLYKTIEKLEETARERVLRTPNNDPNYAIYYTQLAERTYFKYMVADLSPDKFSDEIIDKY